MRRGPTPTAVPASLWGPRRPRRKPRARSSRPTRRTRHCSRRLRRRYGRGWTRRSRGRAGGEIDAGASGADGGHRLADGGRRRRGAIAGHTRACLRRCPRGVPASPSVRGVPTAPSPPRETLFTTRHVRDGAASGDTLGEFSSRSAADYRWCPSIRLDQCTRGTRGVARRHAPAVPAVSFGTRWARFRCAPVRPTSSRRAPRRADCRPGHPRARGGARPRARPPRARTPRGGRPPRRPGRPGGHGR
jgi:hypothetical protein